MINFKSNLTRQILDYYLVNTSEKKYLRELAGILSVDPGNLSKKLAELEKEGFLESTEEGKQKYFFINLKYPFLKEIKKIYQSQFSLPLLLKEKLRKLRGLKEAYIFGSYAKDKLTTASDIDLLLVGDFDSLEANRLVLPLQKNINREINIIDFSQREFLNKQRAGDDFLKHIFSEPTIKVI
jgi:predicted nucleotidyltransferase